MRPRINPNTYSNNRLNNLRNAVLQKDYAEIENILRQGCNINDIGTTGTNALGCALETLDLSMIRFLIHKHADFHICWLNDSKKSNGIARHVDAIQYALYQTSTHAAIRNTNISEKALKIIAYILAQGGELSKLYKIKNHYIEGHYLTPEKILNNFSYQQLFEWASFEAILLGNHERAEKFIKARSIVLKVSHFSHYLLSADLLPKILNFSDIYHCLKMLVKKDILLSNGEAHAFLLSLNQLTPPSLTAFNPPNPSKNDLTLECITANLLYFLNYLDAPATNTQLEGFAETTLNDAERKEKYNVQHLIDFISPKNRDIALIRISRRPDMLHWLYEASIHPKLDEENRNHCKKLIFAFKTLDPDKKIMLMLGNNILEQVEISFANMLTDGMNKLVNVINEKDKRLEELQLKVSHLEQTLEQVLHEVKKDKQLENPKRSSSPTLF